jgi:hypothetical protein
MCFAWALVTVSGGQAWAHAPVHMLCPLVSWVNMYSGRPLAMSTVPSPVMSAVVTIGFGAAAPEAVDQLAAPAASRPGARAMPTRARRAVRRVERLVPVGAVRVVIRLPPSSVVRFTPRTYG